MDLFLDEIIRTVKDVYGRDLSCFEPSFLTKTLRTKLPTLLLTNVEEYPSWLSSHRDQSLAFIDSLTITYSEFFRETLTFATLEHIVLPPLIESKKGSSPLRIWSAGCAGGQEAYSLAILLDELGSAKEKKPSYRIFATDISEDNLAFAQKGVYDSSSLKNVSMSRLEKYFSQAGTSYSLRPELKLHVDFSRHDLLDEHSTAPARSIFGEFDLVLCCNLLFYYTRDVRQKILNRLCKSMAPRGYLATGEAERSEIDRQRTLKAVAAPSTVFQKQG